MLAGSRVEGAHRAVHGAGVLELVGGPADDEHAIDHRHRRVQLHREEPVGRLELHDDRRHVDKAVLPEVRTQDAAPGVDCRQAPVVRGQQYAVGAFGVLRRLRIAPVGHAAAIEAPRIRREVDLGVKVPPLFARGRIQRDDPVERIAQNQVPPRFLRQEYGRDLKAHRAVEMWRALQVACVVDPGDLQLADVGAVDLAQRRVARATLLARISRPARVANIGILRDHLFVPVLTPSEYKNTQEQYEQREPDSRYLAHGDSVPKAMPITVVAGLAVPGGRFSRVPRNVGRVL